MVTFAELLIKFTRRSGITDSELARKIGVRRQTIFRWKEGLVQSPRSREVILDLAKALRLTPDELDTLLLAAGFAPERVPSPREEEIPETVVAEGDVANAAPIDAETSVLTSAVPPGGRTELNSTASLSPVPPSDVERHEASRASRFPVRWLAVLLATTVFASVVFAIFSRLGESTSPPTGVQAEQSEPLAFCGDKSEEETLLVAAEFRSFGSRRYNVAGRLLEALAAESKEGRSPSLRLERLEREIRSSQEAQSFLDECGAEVIIWGEYDDSRVVANITVPSARETRFTEPASLADIPSIINVDVPAEVRVLALEALGVLFRTEGRYDEAIAAFEAALTPPDAMPEDVPTEKQRFTLNFYLGLAHFLHAQLTQAIEAYDRAIAAYDAAFDLVKKPHTIPAELAYNRGLARLGRVHLQGPNSGKGDLDAAIKDFSLALRRRRDYGSALAMRGNAYAARKEPGDLERAIRDYSTALGLDTKADYHFNRALAHIAADHHSSWQIDLEEARKLGFPNRSVYTAACYAHLRQFELQAAQSACELALEEDDQTADTTFVNYGIALAASGETEKGLRYLHQHLDWLQQQPGGYTRYNGAQVEEWIAQLEGGDAPFSAETLAKLE